MSIRTLQHEVFRSGPAYANLIETIDNSGTLVDYEVMCDDAACDRYACVHLKEAEAREEIAAHAEKHRTMVVKSLVLTSTTFGGLQPMDVLVETNEVVEAVQPLGPLVIVDFVGGMATAPTSADRPVDVMRARK